MLQRLAQSFMPFGMTGPRYGMKCCDANVGAWIAQRLSKGEKSPFIRGLAEQADCHLPDLTAPVIERLAQCVEGFGVLSIPDSAKCCETNPDLRISERASE